LTIYIISTYEGWWVRHARDKGQLPLLSPLNASVGNDGQNRAGSEMSQRRTSVIRDCSMKSPPSPFSLANFFRGVMPAVTPKGHEARCFLGLRRQRSEGAVGPLTKSTQGPSEGEGQGREPRGRAGGPGKDRGLKA
jgi:hypothetical protein